MEKRNYLVTGVSRGLGIQIAKTLLQDENVTVYGLSRSKPTELDELMVQYSERMKWMEFDLSDSKNIKGIFKNFVGLKTPLHGFVNNAAMAYDDIVTNLNLDRLKAMYDVNVFTPMMMTKGFIRHCLLHNCKGSIIHISSISVHTGYKGLAMYASSKGALEAFSKDTAREWGEKGIRSNALVAGFMETTMSSTLSADQKDRIYKRTSMKVPTTTKSVAETIRFLLSDGAESITAQNVFVDSGTI